MLHTVKASRADKTAGIAVTYRAGEGNKFGTCPTSCELMHDGNSGTTEIDIEYYRAVRYSVPKMGVAWTYTHFDPLGLQIQTGISFSLEADTYKGPKCTFNFSRPDIDDAARHQAGGVPCVTVVPPDYWDDKPSTKHVTVEVENRWLFPEGEEGLESVRGVRCPHEYNKEVDCRNCGAGTPLCAREDRDYFIIFTGHGSKKDKCYAGQGNCNIWWTRLSKGSSDISDAETHKAFVKSLPPRTMLRPHIAGDIGKESK